MRLFHQIKNLVTAMQAIIKQHTDLAVFFFFLTTSLFLGDGKQPLVDVWWALGILMMYGVRYYQRGKLDLYPLVPAIGLAWMALILYYTILTPFSDSAGYSITATVRLIEAYLVYLMFVTISSEKMTTLFTKGLLFVGVVATLVSFVFLLSPSLANFLPPMNLLYTTYGHNHLADLLLFVFPVAIGLVEKKRSLVTIGLLALFATGMLLTFARGAWILLVFYLLFLALRSKNLTTRRVGLFVAAAIIAALLLISLVSLRGVPQKPSLLADGRWEYWRQAVEAIKERPLFGSGPGTFYLESKRLQARPNSYSWFAHGFPLEMIVEMGVVGATLLSLTLIASLRRARASPLFSPLRLVLLYSFFEFNLNYIAAWLLFWATLGLLTGLNHRHAEAHQKSFIWDRLTVWVALICLSVFYLSWTGSAIVSASHPSASIAFSLAPYQEDKATEYLEDQKKSGNTVPSFAVRAIDALYRGDPDVLWALATVNPVEAKSLYRRALAWDPQNFHHHVAYLRFLLKEADGSLGDFGAGLQNLGLAFLPKALDTEIREIDFSSAVLRPYYTEGNLILLEGPGTPRLKIAKLYYILGLSLLHQDARLTERFWKLAKEAIPYEGMLYAEMASLQLYVFYDSQQADIILRSCKESATANIHCKNVSTLNSLVYPGNLAPHIASLQ